MFAHRPHPVFILLDLDGKLTSADAQWASFKVMVTNADGTTTARSLGQLGITEIDLRPDATHIELPDGSVITGKTTFTQTVGGTTVTKTVADTVLSMDAEGHRVVRCAPYDSRIASVFKPYCKRMYGRGPARGACRRNNASASPG
jgi:hypothetical protein